MKSFVILASVAAVLGGATYYLEFLHKPKQEKLTEENKLIFGKKEIESVESLRLLGTGDELIFEIVQKPEAGISRFQLVKPFSETLVESSVKGFLREVLDSKVKSRIDLDPAEGISLETFGLNQIVNQIELQFKSGERAWMKLSSKRNFQDNPYVFLSKEDGVPFLGESSLIRLAGKDLKSLRDKRVLKGVDLASVTEVVIPKEWTGDMELQIQKSDQAAWELKGKDPFPIRTDELSSLVENLLQLSWEEVVSEEKDFNGWPKGSATVARLKTSEGTVELEMVKVPSHKGKTDVQFVRRTGDDRVFMVSSLRPLRKNRHELWRLSPLLSLKDGDFEAIELQQGKSKVTVASADPKFGKLIETLRDSSLVKSFIPDKKSPQNRDREQELIVSITPTRGDVFWSKFYPILKDKKGDDKVDSSQDWLAISSESNGYWFFVSASQVEELKKGLDASTP